MATSSSSETDAVASNMELNLSDAASNSSFSVCPHCFNKIDSPPHFGSQVHPQSISNSHISFEEFKSKANAALKGRFGGGSYHEVKALLLNWDANDLGLKKPEAGSLILDETMKLMGIFRNLYHFHTEHHLIPSRNPQTKVQKLLGDVIDELSDKKEIGSKEILLIVYYNGHAMVKDGRLIWSARKNWHLENLEFPALSWYDLQSMLEKAKFDVLLILDCCHAAGAVTKGSSGTMEVLAGCSRENKAVGPGGSSVIGSPFTHTLIEHLTESVTRPQGLLTTELQTLLSLDKVLENQSPIHVVLTGHHNPINLRPLISDAKLKEKANAVSQTVKPEVKALLAVSFRGDTLPEMKEFVQWLNSQYPKEVAKIEVESAAHMVDVDKSPGIAMQGTKGHALRKALQISEVDNVMTQAPSGEANDNSHNNNAEPTTFKGLAQPVHESYDQAQTYALPAGEHHKIESKPISDTHVGATLLNTEKGNVAANTPVPSMTRDHLAHNLGLIYADQGKLSEMYKQALTGYETATLMMVYTLGDLYMDQEKLSEAEEMYGRALKGYEKTLGPDHPTTLQIVNNLGYIYAGQGDLVEAEQMYKRALQGYEKTLGPDHTLTLRIITNLGLLYADQGMLVEAEGMYERALKEEEKSLGPDHTSTLRTVNCLGVLYKTQGKLVEAEEMHKRALRGKEKALGPEHTSTLWTVNNLGHLYVAEGKLAEAEEMYNRALKGKEKSLGPDHKSTLRTVNCLGILYKSQGKLAEAEEMFQQALKGYEKSLGYNHAKCEDLRQTIRSLELGRQETVPEVAHAPAAITPRNPPSKFRKMFTRLDPRSTT